MITEAMGLRVMIAGLGPMGRGIARVFARAHAEVDVVDISPEFTEAGLEKIRAEAEADREPVVGVSAAELAAVATADLFIDAVAERMDSKCDLLAQVARLAGPELIVASNTSSLSIGELGQAFGDPSRVVGMHFFNPPTKMRLVEVIAGGRTSGKVLARARRLVDALGKTPVVCRDSPNFIVNRICRPLYYEAQLLLTQGVAVPVVDAAVSGALGHPMGPLTLLDFTGLHTHLGSSETALREFGDPRYRPIPVVRSLVRAGMTGRAAGRGFYDYAAEKPRQAIDKAVQAPAEATGMRVVAAGPDAVQLPETSGSETLTLYSCHRPPTEFDVAAVAALSGRVVVDSADGHWLDVLPAEAGWLRLHRSPRDELFAEVVHDELAGIRPTPTVTAMLAALRATSVEVLALPGLVAERLAYCMINEACAVVEEGTASRADVDTALTLGMNHPQGPFELLESVGAAEVYTSLRSMAELMGDPRYRPAQLLRRQSLGAAR